MAGTTYDSPLDLRLAQVPEGIKDPILYDALDNIHNAVAALAGASSVITGVWIGNLRFISKLADFDNFTDTVITLATDAQYYVVAKVDIGDRVMEGTSFSFQGLGLRFSSIISSADIGALLTTTSDWRAEAISFVCTGSADNLACTGLHIINLSNVGFTGGRPGTLTGTAGSAVVITFSSVESDITPLIFAGNYIRIDLEEFFPADLTLNAAEVHIEFAVGLVVSDRIIASKTLMFNNTGAISYDFKDITGLPNEGVQIQDCTFTGPGIPVAGLLPSDLPAFFRNNLGLTSSYPNAGWIITNNALNTNIGAIGVPVLLATDNIALNSVTQRFSLSGVTLTYLGAQARAFQISCTLTISTSLNNQTIRAILYVNGVPTTIASPARTTGSSGNRVENVTLIGTVGLAPPNFTVDVWLVNDTSSTSMKATDVSFQLAALTM